MARNRVGLISPYKQLARRFGIWRGIISGCCRVLFVFVSDLVLFFSGLFFGLSSGLFRIFFLFFSGLLPAGAGTEPAEPNQAARTHFRAAKSTHAKPLKVRADFA